MNAVDKNTESARCLGCVKSGCRSACPIGNDIPDFLRNVKCGQFQEAVQLIGHPFGEICGYVCPHEKQCQGGCVLARKNQALLIGEIERQVFGEYPYRVERTSDELKGYNVAVVGGGVSGITFAVKAYEQGANVTLYERDKLLSTLKLIPSFRLPKEAIARVERVVSDKIKIVYEDVTAQYLQNELQKRFDAVYVATGAALDYGLGVEGEEYATDYRDCLKSDFMQGKVIVVGGGNSAMDCARYVKSLGGHAVVAYRRTESDMPAFEKEIADAKREGVEFVFNTAPVKLERSGNKLVLTCAKTISEGRGKLEITDELHVTECDYVVAAIGSKFDQSILGQNVKDNDDPFQYGNVWLGGDAKRGKLVADAVADGIRAVQDIIANKRNLCL